MKRTLGLILVSFFVAATAFAQDKKPAAGAAAPAAGKPKVKTYEFDADLLEGNLVTPTGEFSAARTFQEHGSLIKVRTDFVKEIVKSAEDL